MTTKTRASLANLPYLLAVIPLLAISAFPFLWMLLQSLKSRGDVLAYPPKWLFTPTLDNFRNVLVQADFLKYFLNSTLIAMAAVALSLVIGLMAAYSMARYKQSGIGLLVLAAKMIPHMALALPLYALFRQFHLLDTPLGIVLTHVSIALPVTIWVMVSFFEDVPRDLEHAAMIDGASRMRTFFQIALPLVKPGIVAVAVLGFIDSWNNFVFVLILGGRNTMTLPLAAYNFVGFETVDWGGLYAAATTIMLPVIVLAVLAQRFLAEGLSMGALD